MKIPPSIASLFSLLFDLGLLFWALLSTLIFRRLFLGSLLRFKFNRGGTFDRIHYKFEPIITLPQFLTFKSFIFPIPLPDLAFGYISYTPSIVGIGTICESIQNKVNPAHGYTACLKSITPSSFF